jgi:hypothetical protein
MLYCTIISTRPQVASVHFVLSIYMSRRGSAAAVPARQVGAVRLEHHGRARLLPDPDGGSGGALHQQAVQGIRATLAGAWVPRGRPAVLLEGGVGAPVPQDRDARRRVAGALLGRRLHVRAAQTQQVLGLADSGRTGAGLAAVLRHAALLPCGWMNNKRRQ